MKLIATIDYKEDYTIHQTEDERVFLNDILQEYTLKKISMGHFILHKDQKTYEIRIVEQTNLLVLNINGASVEVTIKDHISQLLEKLGMAADTVELVEEIQAPMPGTILEIAVKAGDEVKKGDKLIILEAMKMENVIKSPIDGRINKVLTAPGENVEKNQPLLSF